LTVQERKDRRNKLVAKTEKRQRLDRYNRLSEVDKVVHNEFYAKLERDVLQVEQRRSRVEKRDAEERYQSERERRTERSIHVDKQSGGSEEEEEQVQRGDEETESENWDLRVMGNILESRQNIGEKKYRGMTKTERKNARNLEHNPLECQQVGRANLGVRVKHERLNEAEKDERKKFLVDVVHNTFDFGGGEGRIDEKTNKRYTYRTIQQIGGPGCEVALLKFCKDRLDLFRVTGTEVELLHPRRLPPFVTVNFGWYTLVYAMRELVSQLETEDSSYGFDAEFFSYNIYEPEILKSFKSRVREDYKAQLGSNADVRIADFYTDNVIRNVKKKRYRNNDIRFPRLATERGIRTIQIYSESRDMAYVFYLRRGCEQQTLIESGLAHFIENKNIAKYVVGWGDVEFLEKRYFLKCESFVDLQEMASKVIRDVIAIPSKMPISSNVLAISCGLGQPEFKHCTELCKDPDLKTMGWMFDSLCAPNTTPEYRRDLVQYAAYDSYAAKHIGNFLQRLLRPSAGSPM
jgi:hypothetical protein